MQLYDIVHDCYRYDNIGFDALMKRFFNVIDIIRNDPTIGDAQPNARELRRQIFRVTNVVGVPLLYMPLMNTIRWTHGNSSQSSLLSRIHY
jgi:hypothetical protein